MSFLLLFLIDSCSITTDLNLNVEYDCTRPATKKKKLLPKQPKNILFKISKSLILIYFKSFYFKYKSLLVALDNNILFDASLQKRYTVRRLFYKIIVVLCTLTHSLKIQLTGFNKPVTNGQFLQKLKPIKGKKLKKMTSISFLDDNKVQTGPPAKRDLFNNNNNTKEMKIWASV